MKDRTAAAIIHGFIAALVETAAAGNISDENGTKVVERTKELARDYLAGKEIDNLVLDDRLVESTIMLVEDEIEGNVNATKQGYPNA